MKRIITLNGIFAAILLWLMALPGVAAPTATTAGLDANLNNYLQLLRSDANSNKVELVSSIVKLSPDDAKKFWPIYHEYENELDKQSRDRARLVVEFVQAHKDGSFDNAKASDIAKRWFKFQRARLDLLEKYHGKIEQALSPVQAGQFLQMENQIGLFIDITIASEMPIVGSKGK